MICRFFHKQYWTKVHRYFPWNGIDRFSWIDVYVCKRCHRNRTKAVGSAVNWIHANLALTEYYNEMDREIDPALAR